MKKAKHVLVVAAAVLMAAVGSTSLAEARGFHGHAFHVGGFHHGWHGGPRWRGGHVWRGGYRWRHGWHGRRWWGYGIYPGVVYGGYYGGGGCGWLHRRAVVTGSPYWWRRYRACVGYY